MADLLSRKSYREVLKSLDHYRAQHEQDRRENPDLLPATWGAPLRESINRIVRKNGEKWHKRLADQVLEYLADKGLLVRYVGDYTFLTNEKLPTKQQIIDRTKEEMNKLFS